MTIAAGGADKESRESRLTKDAKIDAGRWLKKVDSGWLMRIRKNE